MVSEETPLSPFLFIIAVDVLKKLLFQAADCSYLNAISKSNCTLNPHQFADDTVFLMDADTNQIVVIKHLLTFYSTIGLTINLLNVPSFK